MKELGTYSFEGIPKVYLFDMLAYGDKSLCNLKLIDRKVYLKKVVDDKLLIEANSFMIPTEDIEDEISKVSIIAKQAGVEGLVVKGL